MSKAVYGEVSSTYEMDWETVRYTLESGTGTGEYGGNQYGPTAFSTGCNTDNDRDRYAPGRSDDTLTGYGFLDLSVSYKGRYTPSYPM